MAFSETVGTTALPQHVWQVWTDVACWHLWDLGLRSAQAEGQFAQGLTGTLVDTSGRTSRFVISHYDPGRSYWLDTRLPLGLLRVERCFASLDPCVIEHRVSFHGIGGALLSPILTRQFRKLLRPSMQRLAHLAEQAAHGGTD